MTKLSRALIVRVTGPSGRVYRIEYREMPDMRRRPKCGLTLMSSACRYGAYGGVTHLFRINTGCIRNTVSNVGIL